MSLLLAFSVVLLVPASISEPAQHGVLSTAVLFPVAGFVLGGGVFGVVQGRAGEPLVRTLAELALFSMCVHRQPADQRDRSTIAGRLPGRALLLGMPLTFLLTALLGAWVAGTARGFAHIANLRDSPSPPPGSAAALDWLFLPHHRGTSPR